jgi:hypothetical protein
MYKFLLSICLILTGCSYDFYYYKTDPLLHPTGKIISFYQSGLSFYDLRNNAFTYADLCCGQGKWILVDMTDRVVEDKILLNMKFVCSK